jgi:hypothetical protein
MEDFIYYNGSIICKKDNLDDIDYRAEFDDETVENIVNNASNYLFAIARYDMKVPTLPILDMTPVPNQSNQNLLTYALRIFGTIGGNNVDSNMINFIYQPRNNRNDNQGYYFIYNYHHFCDIMNVAFSTATSAISSSNPSPTICYDSSTSLFSIFTNNDSYNLSQTGSNEHLQIQFNQELYNLLRHFNYILNIDNSATLIVNNYISNTSGNYIINTQNLSSTGSIWSPVGQISFDSNSMQLNNEIIGNSSYVGTSVPIGLTKSNKEANLITDIIIDLNSSIDYNNNIVYVPNTYRWIDPYRINNLNKIKFSVYWTHKMNRNIHYPLLMSNGSTITIKLHFKRKF